MPSAGGRHTFSSQNLPTLFSPKRPLESAQKPAKTKNLEYVGFQREVLMKCGYFGVSFARILEYGTYTGQNYQIGGNTALGVLCYLIIHINTIIKSVFLTFLAAGYFGPIRFVDKIAMLDYILCAVIVGIGAWVFLRRYPFYEILVSMWKILNSIYWKHGCPNEMRAEMDKIQRTILAQHLFIIFGGCTSLMIQYFPAPKYCNFTYSTFELENLPLRILFGMHEFLFLMMSWNAYGGHSTMCMYQGVAMSNAIFAMNDTLRRLFLDEMKTEKVVDPKGVERFVIRRNLLQPQKVVPDTEYDIEKILFDYKQLMIIAERFNDWTAYKHLVMHIIGGMQFSCDIYSAFHVLRQPGTGFLDVWFYIWDCSSAGFMLVRVYQFMCTVSDASEIFLQSLKEYFTFRNPKRLYLRKVAKTLKIVTLKVGPVEVWPETFLAVIDSLGQYYICAALW